MSRITGIFLSNPLDKIKNILCGSLINPATEPNFWGTAGNAGTSTYNAGELTLSSVATGSSEIVASHRQPIQTSQKYVCYTAKITKIVKGTGQYRYLILGFANNLNSSPAAERACFMFENDIWYCSYYDGSKPMLSLPYGKELQAGDVVNVVIDRTHETYNSDVILYYVNNELIYVNEKVPTVDVFARMSVHVSYGTSSCQIASDYISIERR